MGEMTGIPKLHRPRMYALTMVRSFARFPEKLRVLTGPLVEQLQRMGVKAVFVDVTAEEKLSVLPPGKIKKANTLIEMLNSELFDLLQLKSVLVHGPKRGVIILGDKENLAKVKDYVDDNFRQRHVGERHLSSSENHIV